MYGTILGDIVWNIYGANRTAGIKQLERDSLFSGVSTLTIGIAEAILNYFLYDNGTHDISGNKDAENLRNRFYVGMMKWSYLFPSAGYSEYFREWRKWDDNHSKLLGPEVSAIITPIAWLFDGINVVRKVAAICATIVNDSREWIEAAEAISSAVYLSRKGCLKPQIKGYIEREFAYELDYMKNSTQDRSSHNYAQAAISAFLVGKGPEEVVYKAACISGNSNIVKAMAGAVSEAYYGLEDKDIFIVEKMLSEKCIAVLRRFDETKYQRINTDSHKPIRISQERVELLPKYAQEIARHYCKYSCFNKTSDDYGVSEKRVEAILRLAELYTDRKHRDGTCIADYINELSTVEFTKGREKQLHLLCGTWIRNEDEMIIDMVRFSDRELTIEEICNMTGLPEYKVEHTLRMIRIQQGMHASRKWLLNYLDDEQHPI